MAGADSLFAGIRATSKHELIFLKYPKDSALAGDFKVTDEDVVLVQNMGGIQVAGLNVWLVPPGKEPITGFCFAGPSRFLVMKQEGEASVLYAYRVTDQGVSGTKKCALPYSACRLYADRSGNTWIAGSNSDGLSSLWRYDGKKKDPELAVAQLKKPISAVTWFPDSALWMSSGNRLMRLNAEHKIDSIISFDRMIYGFAADERGNLFVSTRSGIYQRNQQGNVETLLAQVHGPIILKDGKLYCLWREQGVVVVVNLVR